MEIKIPLEKIPKGPAGKIALGLGAIYCTYKYSTEYLIRGFPNPLSPSTLCATFVGILLIIVVLFFVQERYRKRKSR